MTGAINYNEAAREWGLAMYAASIMTRVSDDKSWHGQCYRIFDIDLRETHLSDDGRLYLQSAFHTQPAVYIEKTADGLDMVFEFGGTVMHRETIPTFEYHDLTRKFSI